jgi:hypothetical protein
MLLTYSTIKSANLSKALKHTKTNTTFFILLCLNYATRYYLNTKVDFSLLCKLLILANSKATKLLLLPLTLNARLLTNALEEYLSTLILP